MLIGRYGSDHSLMIVICSLTILYSSFELILKVDAVIEYRCFLFLLSVFS